jgi:hypothetical protein
MKADIFALLDASRLPEPAQASLPILSLWRVATYYLMFFTLHPDKFATHYDDDQGSYHCPGEGCPACAVGLKPTEHVYLPVWDAQNRQVAVLKFDTRPDGPAAKVLGFLRTYREQLTDVVAVVDCQGKGNFSITAHKPLPETERGALACQAFSQGLESGTISLRCCAKQLTGEEVAKLHTVQGRAARVVGEPVAPTNPARQPVGDKVPPPADGKGA